LIVMYIDSSFSYWHQTASVSGAQRP